MVLKMTWCDRFWLSCRSGSRFEFAQADSTISTDCPRLWKCVRARVLTPRHEDEMWMVQLVPVSSRDGLTRQWMLSLFTVARHHLQSKMSRRKNCTKKATFQDVTANTIVVVVDDQPVLT